MREIETVEARVVRFSWDGSDPGAQEIVDWLRRENVTPESAHYRHRRGDASGRFALGFAGKTFTLRPEMYIELLVLPTGEAIRADSFLLANTVVVAESTPRRAVTAVVR